ncbi:MAG: beta-lactamase family protein, partial [Chitinophagaceae bacterium]|nr:beta-lactamase family protein [Chitinophagaceae bacterium]
MKKILLILLITCIGIGLQAQTVPEKLDAYFTAAHEADRFNGSVLIMQNGQPLLNKGYGYKDFDSKQPDDSNTIYQIGSVTKQFTSSIILKLAEQHKLSLGNTISKYFPSFPNGNKITIEHLLTHTSGIWNYTRDEKFMSTGVEKPHSEE